VDREESFGNLLPRELEKEDALLPAMLSNTKNPIRLRAFE